jgi:hypothetical protein
MTDLMLAILNPVLHLQAFLPEVRDELVAEFLDFGA